LVGAHHEQEGFKKAEPPAAETPVEPLVSDTEPIELKIRKEVLKMKIGDIE
jgi:hypothetical protein